MVLRALLLLLIGVASGEAAGAAQVTRVRVGFLPHLIQAPVLVAQALEARGEPWFAPRLAGTEVEWRVFRAGPAIGEGLLTRGLDLAYLGPVPALNAHLRTRGEEIRVLAGSVRGGAALVVRRHGPIRQPSDFAGRTLATTAFGNTQDIFARAWLRAQGFRVNLHGGDVAVVPTPAADQFALWQAGRLDAAWTVEPWVSRLVAEGDAEIWIDQQDEIASVLVARRRFLEENGDLVARWTAAHRALLQWMVRQPEQARTLAEEGFAALARRPLPPAAVEQAWSRLHFEADLGPADVAPVLAAGEAAGFWRPPNDLSRLFAP